MSKGRLTESYVLMPGGLNLDWAALFSDIPDDANKCKLVALDNRQLSVIHDLLTNVRWYWLWNVDRADTAARTAIQDFIEELEDCLMSGCDVSALITKLDEIDTTLDTRLAALEDESTGIGSKLTSIATVLLAWQSGGLLAALQAIAALGASGVIDNLLTELMQAFNTGPGDTPYLESMAAIDTQDEITAVTVALTAIKDSIDAQTGEDLEDDLANVWSQLSAILEVVGGITEPPGTPL